jgi:hypothetical protein
VEPLPLDERADVDDEDHAEAAGAEAEGDEPMWREEESEDDDPFLAELRRAVVDTEPLGPRDHVEHPDAGHFDDDEGSSGGFLRRRRRG